MSLGLTASPLNWVGPLALRYIRMVPPPSDSSKSAASSVVQGEGVRQGGLSQAEFREVYEKHATEILRFAIRYTGRREIAEEFTSEAFLKMYENRDRIDPQRAAAWLTAAVKNLAIDYWRRAETERKYQSIAPEAIELQTDQKWEDLLAHPTLKPPRSPAAAVVPVRPGRRPVCSVCAQRQEAGCRQVLPRQRIVRRGGVSPEEHRTSRHLACHRGHYQQL